MRPNCRLFVLNGRNQPYEELTENDGALSTFEFERKTLNLSSGSMDILTRRAATYTLPDDVWILVPFDN